MGYKGWVGYKVIKILHDRNGYIAKVHSYLKQCIAQSMQHLTADVS